MQGLATNHLIKQLHLLFQRVVEVITAFKNALAVKRLPKTRSGKILRRTLQQIADGEEWKMPATIDDPAILDEITVVLKDRGVGKAFSN